MAPSVRRALPSLARDERAIPVLLAAVLAALQPGLIAARWTELAMVVFVLVYRLGRRFPDQSLRSLVAAMAVVRVALVLPLPKDPLWLVIVGMPIDLAIYAALLTTGQDTGRRERGDLIPPHQARRASIVVGLAWVLTALAFSSLVIAGARWTY